MPQDRSFPAPHRTDFVDQGSLLRQHQEHAARERDAQRRKNLLVRRSCRPIGPLLFVLGEVIVRLDATAMRRR
jgi:hypothetical protein